MENSAGKDFSLECESTDTIAHPKAKVHDIEGIPPHEQRLAIDDKQLDNNFSENMTLADFGIQEKFMIQQQLTENFQPVGMYRGSTGQPQPRLPKKMPYINAEAQMAAGEREKICRRNENAHLYAHAFMPAGWGQESDKELLHLLLELCQDGTISEGNVTDEIWLRIQNVLQNSTNCSFQIDILKQRLCDYKQLYSLLTETSSPIFHWDCEKKTIIIKDPDWMEHHPELLSCGAYIPYFDTLKEVCEKLNISQSSEQQASETSTSINIERRVDQDIPRRSNIRTIFPKFGRGM